MGSTFSLFIPYSISYVTQIYITMQACLYFTWPCNMLCYYFSKYKHAFFPYVATADSEPRCHSWGVLISWYGVCLAHLHSSAQGAEWMSWLTCWLCLDTVCLWVSHNLPGVHKFCSLFVHKIQWRSLPRFLCEGLFKWGESGSRLFSAEMWKLQAFLPCSCPSSGRAGWRCLMGRADHRTAAPNTDKWHQFCNIAIFKHTHFQNLFTVNSLHLDVVS